MNAFRIDVYLDAIAIEQWWGFVVGAIVICSVLSCDA
jgi:hypothetical protein